MYIYPGNEDTPLYRKLYQVPKVSTVEGLHYSPTVSPLIPPLTPPPSVLWGEEETQDQGGGAPPP